MSEQSKPKMGPPIVGVSRNIKRVRELIDHVASTGLNTVALSGGVFCNRYLADRVVRRLNEAGFVVLCHRAVPANDGGIALGQAAIATSVLDHAS